MKATFKDRSIYLSNEIDIRLKPGRNLRLFSFRKYFENMLYNI